MFVEGSADSSSRSSHERRVAAWAALQFFLLLSSLYVVRPLRDEMGIAAGVQDMQWLFTGTFVGALVFVPAVGWACARLSRAVVVPAFYGLMAALMVLAYGAIGSMPEGTTPWVARVLFVWLSIFNVLAVSLFWSLLADLLDPEQGRRSFGRISAGGTVGALLGPLLAGALAQRLSPIALLPVTAGLLLAAALGSIVLQRQVLRTTSSSRAPVGGGIWSGLTLFVRRPELRGIGLYVLAMTWISTVLYFEQAHVIAAEITDSAERTALFAGMDFAVNALSLLVQLFGTAVAVRRLGLGAILVALPLVSGIALVVFASFPVLAILVVVQVVRRSTNFALSKPAREMLFLPVEPEAKYKAKNVIDTLVYRGGDAAAGWAFAGLQALGAGLGLVAWATAPIALAWGWLGWRLGGRRADEVEQAPRRDA